MIVKIPTQQLHSIAQVSSFTSSLVFTGSMLSCFNVVLQFFIDLADNWLPICRRAQAGSTDRGFWRTEELVYWGHISLLQRSSVRSSQTALHCVCHWTRNPFVNRWTEYKSSFLQDASWKVCVKRLCDRWSCHSSPPSQPQLPSDYSKHTPISSILFNRHVYRAWSSAKRCFPQIKKS